MIHEQTWLDTLLQAVVPLLITALTGLLAWLGKKGATLIEKLAQKSHTGEYAAWYATAFNLAGIAVKFAETKYGPDSGTGEKKKAEAVSWLKARLVSLDPGILNTPNLDSLLNGLVDAAYNDLFVALRPLAPGQGAPVSTG